MSIRIYDTDSREDIAKKIYYDLDINQSVTIFGFYRDEELRKLVPKGEVILGLIKDMYEEEFVNKIKKKLGGMNQRVYKYRPNSIGGPIAHKIFTWEKRVVESEPRYTIWRFQ